MHQLLTCFIKQLECIWLHGKVSWCQTSLTEKLSVFTVVYESSVYTKDQNKTQLLANTISNSFYFHVDNRAMDFLLWFAVGFWVWLVGWFLMQGFWGFLLGGCCLFCCCCCCYGGFFWLLVQRKEKMFHVLSLLKLRMCDQYLYSEPKNWDTKVTP